MFIFFFVLSWSKAQRLQSEQSFAVILSEAAVEWGAAVSLLVAQLFSLKAIHETPPIGDQEVAPQQIPVIFVPSLHSGSGVFIFLVWRLKKNFWNSLWPFRWKSFLRNPEFLKDQLLNYIEEVLRKTNSKRFRLVSFGSSRQIISQILQDSRLRNYCDRWLAISGPEKISEVHQFLRSQTLIESFSDSSSGLVSPDIVIVGETDSFCYPENVWGDVPVVKLSNVGHFGAALHSTTTRTIMHELGQ